MTVTVMFTVTSAEYRALTELANARRRTVPTLYRDLGRQLAARVADGSIPLADPRGKRIPARAASGSTPPPVRGRGIPRLSGEQIARLVECHLRGGTLAHAAAAAGCSANTVGGFITRYNLPRHTKGIGQRREAPMLHDVKSPPPRDELLVISSALRERLIADGVSEAWIAAACIVSDLTDREQAAIS